MRMAAFAIRYGGKVDMVIATCEGAAARLDAFRNRKIVRSCTTSTAAPSPRRDTYIPRQKMAFNA